MTCRPHNDDSTEREPTPLEQALGWVVRCERGLTEEQECALADWLGAGRACVGTAFNVRVYRDAIEVMPRTWRMTTSFDF